MKNCHGCSGVGEIPLLRIIREPVRVKPTPGEHGTNTTHKIMLISCDDGRDYTLQQLAEYLGVKKQKIVYQITSLGWDHPQVLDPHFGKLPPPRKSGNALWHQLSTKSRFKMLLKIPPAGSWEEKQQGPKLKKKEDP